MLHPAPSTSSAAPAYRGYPGPVDNLPFPFSVWPIGGTVSIGQPFTISTPLMTALYNGPHGEAWKRTRVAIYGRANDYFNDLRGQRTGFRTRYFETGVSWNHWVGSTLVFRPELRFDHAFDSPA